MASARTSVALALLLMSFWPSWLLLLPSAAGRRTITRLPGFHGPLPVELETGYVTVGESDAGNMFYYFIKSERNPAEDPVLVWLAGGPGCSGLSAMVYEIGPLTFDVKANNSGGLPTLVYRSESWTKVCSIIFLDSPLGTGFSYATIETYEVGDLKTSKEVYTFIRKWFGDHPEFISNPLYIGGDSYSGMTVPVVAQQVSNGIQARLEPLLNLKGYLVGNPSTDLKFDGGSFIPYAHGMGLISDELYEGLRGINTVHILEPSCTFAASKPEPWGMHGRRFLDEHAKNLDAKRRHLSEQARNLHLRLPSSEKCRTDAYVLSITWANDESVREALGIHKQEARGNKTMDVPIAVLLSLDNERDTSLGFEKPNFQSYRWSRGVCRHSLGIHDTYIYTNARDIRRRPGFQVRQAKDDRDPSGCYYDTRGVFDLLNRQQQWKIGERENKQNVDTRYVIWRNRRTHCNNYSVLPKQQAVGFPPGSLH